MEIVKLFRLPFTAFVFVLAVQSLLAQSAGTGALTGTVTDPTGSVIPNSTVTLTSNDTAQVRTTSTAADGVYKFVLLPPGAYKVRFTATGFKTTEVSSVNINVTETPVLDRRLEVGQIGDQVTVTTAVEALDTATSTLGTTVESKTVTALPLSNRNYTQILGLSAGASVGVNNATAFGKATQDMSVNGNDPAQNNFQMDGVAINNVANSGSSNDSGIYAGIGIPNPDAIAEFKIQTSTYDASYGRNPGANVNVVTKSGTNQFHGTAFEFFRNSVLNANSFFYNRDDPASATRKQVFNQNQFGGVLGGPIKKDKLFVFGSYQGTRQKNGVAAQGQTNGALLPPIPGGDRSAPGFQAALAAANCNFPTLIPPFGGSLNCDGSNISPVAMKILQLKNTDGSYYVPSSGTAGFKTVSFSQPAIYKEDQVLVNGDYLLNSKNTIATRFFYTRNPQQITLNGFLPGSPTSQFYANTNAALRLTTIVSSAFVNELRGSFQRNVASATDTLPPGATDQALGITPIGPATVKGGVNTAPNATEAPFIVMAGNGFNLFGGLNPSYSPTTQMQIADQISWTHGRHTIRAGFEYEETQWNIVFAGLERGFLIMGNFNDLLIGGPGNILQCLFCVRSGPDGIIHGYRLPNMNSYVQDDWKVNSKLTVNIGVRWEFDGTLADKYGNLTNVNPDLMRTAPPSGPNNVAGNYIGYVVPNNFVSHYGNPPPGVVIEKSSLSIPNHPPYSNFGPRIGLAYAATDKLVVRAGAGIFYDRVGADRFVHSVEQGNPYAVTLDYGLPNAFTLANPFPATPVVGQFAQRWIDPNCGSSAFGCSAANSSFLNLPFLSPSTHTPTVRQYNINFQYQFAKSWVLEAGYVGSSGINLTDYNHNYNTAGLASASNPINGQTTNTSANLLLRVPYLGYQPTGLQGTAYDGISNYNSLQVTVRKQFSRGFTMQGAYTWSKSLTDLVTNTANSNNASDLAQQYGPATFNRPQRLVVNYSYDLPFGNRKGITGKVLNGWNVSGVTTVQTGDPMTIIDSRGGSIYGTGTGTTTQGGYSRAQLCPGVTYSQIASSGDLEQRLGGNSGGPGYFSTGSFCAPPALGTGTDFGNSGVGIIRGPGQFNWDITALKTTRIGERQSVQFRTEFFNTFNHAQFNNPNAPASFAPNVNTPNFGRITSTSVNPRVIQFALKYIF
jgi:hypothetical protein